MCCIWLLTQSKSAIASLKRKLQFAVYDDALYGSLKILNVSRRVSRILKTKAPLTNRLAERIGAMLRYTWGLIRSPHGDLANAFARGSFSIERRLRRIGDLESLYERLSVKHAGLIWIKQDEDYLKWRITGNPHNQHLTYFSYRGALLAGYCYVAVCDDGAAYLTDLTFGDPEAGLLLLQTVLVTLRLRNISSVSYLGNMKNPLIRGVFSLLGRFGFIARPTATSFLLRDISGKDARLSHDIADWYVNGLWTEGFQY